MQVNLKITPYIFARNNAGQMVQIAGRAGDLGRFANVVVPDERVIRRLRPVIDYFQKMPPRRFNYGFRSGYTKYSRQPHHLLEEIQLNRTDDLPLFKKR